MKLENAIEVKDVSMCFNLSREKVDSIKEYVIKMLKRQLFYEEFWALKDVSFEIRKGDSVGLIGMNGSGKSTMLKIIAGVLKPTKGTVETTGTIAPMIELGAGFDHDLTARENIFLERARSSAIPRRCWRSGSTILSRSRGWSASWMCLSRIFHPVCWPALDFPSRPS